MKTGLDNYRDKVWNYLKSEYMESTELLYESLLKEPKNNVISREVANNILLNNIEIHIKQCHENKISIPDCAYKVLFVFSFCGIRRD